MKLCVILYHYSSPPHVKTIQASDTVEHQPTVWLVPYACTQPYHPGNDSHGFRPRYMRMNTCANVACKHLETISCDTRFKHVLHVGEFLWFRDIPL